MVQVAAAVFLIEACTALGPNVLTADARIALGVRVAKDLTAVCGGVGVRPIAREAAVADLICHGIGHEVAQRIVQLTVHGFERRIRRNAVKPAQAVPIILSAVVALRLLAERGADLVTCAGVSACGKRRAAETPQKGQDEAQAEQSGK